jgi:hypothetical protein
MQGMYNVVQTAHDDVGREARGNFDFGWIPCDGVANALGSCLPNPNIVTSIRIEGEANVPPIESMGGHVVRLEGFSWARTGVPVLQGGLWGFG